MRILFTTVHPAPYFDRLFDFFYNNGVETESWYISAASKEKGWKQYKPSNVKLYSDMPFMTKLKRCIEKDLVIFHWGNKTNLILAFFLYFTKTKFGFYMDYPDPATTKTKGIAFIIKRIALSLSDYIFPACYSCADYMKETYSINNSAVKVFPYTHSYASDNIANINAVRKAKLVTGEKLKLLIASRFIERKGYYVVEQAFNVLKQRCLLDEMEIDIVGNGELFEHYKKSLSSLSGNIRFHGWVENDSYEKMLDNTDVYLHPSLFEPFGIPPLDAMERGKYVIVSDGVKSTDIYQNHQGIRVYKSNSYEELACVLSDIIKNKGFLYDYTSDNPRICQEKYSLFVNLNALKL